MVRTSPHMSRGTDRQIQATSFHFQQREHLRTSPHMSRGTDRKIQATRFHFQQREHLCRASVHSFFIDCQSLRELRITSVLIITAFQKEMWVGFKCNGPVNFFSERRYFKYNTCVRPPTGLFYRKSPPQLYATHRKRE